jgi:hypothetical protein
MKYRLRTREMLPYYRAEKLLQHERKCMYGSKDEKSSKKMSVRLETVQAQQEQRLISDE